MNINREGNKEKTISDSIEECFQQLNKSEQSGDVELFTAFKYGLNDDEGKNAVEEGIGELKTNLPFLFAFNDIVKEIVINGERFVKRIENADKEENIQFIHIEGDHSNFPIVIKKDANHEIFVAIAIKDKEVIELEKLPKIYVGMPLTETADYINLPFVINSINFIPTKERDALSSGEEINKMLLSRAIELYKDLLTEISAQKDIKGLFRTVNIQLVPDEKISQNPLWKDFNEKIKSVFKEIIKEVPLVKTYEGKKEIEKTNFPAYGDICKVEDNMKIELFTKFCSLAKQIKRNIPLENEINNWLDIAEKLKNVAVLSNLIYLYDIKELIKELEGENLDAFEDFKQKFGLQDAKQFLKSIFELCEHLYKKNIISNYLIENLLPSQSGRIGGLQKTIYPSPNPSLILSIDENIPEDLKNIFENMGWKIRAELLDNDFVEYKIATDYIRDKMNTDRALETICKKKRLTEDMLKEDEGKVIIDGWVNLFRWCVKNEKLRDNFPVITKDKKIQEIRLYDEHFLIPFIYMGIEEEYEKIYPENKIIYQKYFEIDNVEEILDGLKKYEAFITRLPIYEDNLTFGYNKLESILSKKSDVSKVDHKIEIDKKIISTLPFWTDVVGRISSYQDRGKLFFQFIVRYLINNDESWLEKVTVNCSCKDKSHEILPSQWLASLKSDSWVPYKVVENNQEKIVRREATKESIENLFTREELKELIKSNPDKITMLLPHFGFDELDLKITLYSSEKKSEPDIRKDLSKLVGLTDVLKEMPDLPDIAIRNPAAFKEAVVKLRERLDSEPIKEENKRIGENVEKIVAKILQDKGFTVRPIYKGGDLEIWPDGEGFDAGLIELESYILEVKFTSGSRVHLSKAQSEMAQDKEANYLILVVENVGNLRERLKEIDKDSISEDIITDVVKNSNVVEEIYTKLGAFPNPDEIEPDIHGYWVKKRLWNDKNNVIKWIEQEFGDGV